MHGRQAERPSHDGDCQVKTVQVSVRRERNKLQELMIATHTQTQRPLSKQPPTWTGLYLYVHEVVHSSSSTGQYTWLGADQEYLHNCLEAD